MDARQVAVLGGGVALAAVLAAAALTPAVLVTYGVAFNVETSFARMWPVVLLVLSFATACVVLLLGLYISNAGAKRRPPPRPVPNATGGLLTRAEDVAAGIVVPGEHVNAAGGDAATTLQLTPSP